MNSRTRWWVTVLVAVALHAGLALAPLRHAVAAARPRTVLLSVRAPVARALPAPVTKPLPSAAPRPAAPAPRPVRSETRSTAPARPTPRAVASLPGRRPTTPRDVPGRVAPALTDESITAPVVAPVAGIVPPSGRANFAPGALPGIVGGGERPGPGGGGGQPGLLTGNGPPADLERLTRTVEPPTGPSPRRTGPPPATLAAAPEPEPARPTLSAPEAPALRPAAPLAPPAPVRAPEPVVKPQPEPEATPLPSRPKPLNRPQPSLPASVRRALEQPVAVTVAITVSAAGQVTGVAVTASSGLDAVDQAALTACRRWTFSPAQSGATFAQTFRITPQ